MTFRNMVSIVVIRILTWCLFSFNCALNWQSADRDANKNSLNDHRINQTNDIAYFNCWRLFVFISRWFITFLFGFLFHSAEPIAKHQIIYQQLMGFNLSVLFFFSHDLEVIFEIIMRQIVTNESFKF